MKKAARPKSPGHAYLTALEAVAEATRKMQTAQDKLNDAFKTFGREKAGAEEELRIALETLQKVSKGCNGSS